MIGFTAFKTKKPRQFNYKPRYFDPEKEAREERRKILLGGDDTSTSDGEYKPGQYVRGLSMRRGIIADRSNQRKRSNLIRLAVIVGFVVIALIFIFR